MEAQANYSTEKSILNSIQKTDADYLNNFCKEINKLEFHKAETVMNKVTSGIKITPHVRIESDRGINFNDLHKIADELNIEISDNIHIYAYDNTVVCLMVVRL